MKKKTFMKTVIALALAAATTVATIGCNRGGGTSNGGGNSGGGNNSDNTTINTSKSQLYVRYYAGGAGRNWMDNAIAEFEAAYADKEFESGKKGVQVIKDFDKSGFSDATVKESSNQVFIGEINYYKFVSSEVMLDISDVVKGNAVEGPNKSESVTIESKLRDDQKNFYNIGAEGNKKYYGLPSYETSMNINYNVSVFENKNLYFAAGTEGTTETWTEEKLKSKDVEELFVKTKNAKKSKGPDGEENTYDDGLPATYNDFQALLTCMVRRGVVPFIWNGTSTDYLTGLANEVWANNEGYEQMMLNMSFEGTATNLIEFDSNGKMVFENGSPKLRSATSITPKTAYELHATKGLYDAVRFVKMMMGTTAETNPARGNTYRYKDSMTMDYRSTQEYFLNGKDKNKTNGQDIGMMVEGTWWESEARTNFVSEEDRRSEERHYAIMPLPKASLADVGKNNVKISERNTIAFINANCPANAIPIAKEFLKFLYSDKTMNEFSKDTDMLIAMNYELTEETLAAMSNYGRSVYQVTRASNTDMMEWNPTSVEAKKRTDLLEWSKYGFSLSSGLINPYLYFFEESSRNNSAQTYFEGIYSNFKNSWPIK